MPSATIEEVDSSLRNWVSGLLGQCPVSLEPPSDVHEGFGVSLYLLGLVPAPPTANTRRLPLQVSLRYLVTTWAEQPEEAHRLLGQLVFSAMEHPDFEVELQSMPEVVWNSFGAKPRPSFVLQLPLRRERPEIPAKLVRKPLVMKVEPVSVLRGVVLSTDDVPLVGAEVALPSLRVSQRTDVHGRFRFAVVPREPSAKLLIVRTKGKEQRFPVVQSASGDEPVVLRFEWRED